ncbi:MAG TPA: metal ABC transporter substrate-binding protein [Candidatus Krumholzibacteria bacterium]|nr:metal ABC transporter substrate-binding protein [Candidatus Krumholzibacteria bacterium]
MNKLLAAMIVLAATAAPVSAKVNVVTSTSDLASITALIGGDLVEVTSLAAGNVDPHFVEVLPSYMIKVKKAKLYLRVGLDLDRWSLPIIDGSRNNSLLVVDCSRHIAPLNAPTGKVDASMGDIHPQGNPHYWLDPDNGVVVAADIAEALERVDPGNAADYRAGLDRFKSETEKRKIAWREKASSLSHMQIVTFHDTWPYFCRAFGLDVAGFVEPLPGIEPTPSHTAGLIELIKAKDIRLIGVEPYKSIRTPEAIARATGAKIIVLPPSVGGAPGADDYFALFDVLLDTLREGAR